MRTQNYYQSNNVDMTPDKKVEEYLVRAFDIIKNKFIEKSEFKIGNIIEIAKMIQLEEHRVPYQALQDLKSRIPQLTERIEKEVLTQIQLDLDNGKFHSICSNETTFTKYIINTLKGGKEN